jgi:hypothetical protein
MVSDEFVQELEDRLIQKKTELRFAQEDFETAPDDKKEGLKDKIKKLNTEIKEAEAQLEAAKAEQQSQQKESKKQEGQEKKAMERASQGSIIKRTGTAIKKGYDSVNEPFMQAQRDVKAAAKHAHPWLIALVALAIHAWDVINQFDRSSNAMVMIILYFFFTLYVIFFYYKSDFTPESGTYFGISLLAFALPYLLRVPYLNKMDYLTFLLVFVPVWFLYIALNEPDSLWLNRLGRWLLIAIVIALAVIVLGSVTFPDTFAARGVSLGQPLQRVWTDIGDSWARIKERVVSGGLFSWTQWKQKLNTTFNPYAQFYAGQVEENKQEPTGVYITKLDSLYPMTYVGTAPVIMGRVEAKTFLPHAVQLTPSCRLERPGHNFYGTPDPDPAKGGNELELNYMLVRDVTCTFPIAENMTAGTYSGVLGISFPYETWAYVTETFVSRDLIESYLKQGRDINRELDIDKATAAIYTNGPVGVGVSTTDQPIDIDLNSRTGRYIQQRFGFTIENRWTQGKVEGGSAAADVIIPQPFELRECSPTAPASTEQVNGTTVYHFNRGGGIQLDPRLDYSTVTCQLVLPSKEAAQQVLNFGEKTPVTFVVIAKYEYTIEKKVPVKISQ